MMKAVISTKYGGPEILKLQEVPLPIPSPNQVRVKIHATSVTRAATMMRTGKPYIGRLIMGCSKPKHPISGTNFAGVIESVGQNVSVFKVGDKVFGENIETFGTNAEYVCIEQNGIITHIPENLSFNEATGICDGALTSINFIKNIAKLKRGQHILINGASGSLGSAAVQIAKSVGAIVTGVCSKKNMELVKSIGADYVIDYKQVDYAKTGLVYDVIYDTVGTRTFTNSKKALTKNGIYMSPVLSFPLLLKVISTSIFSSKKAKFSATGMLALKDQLALFHELVTLIKEDKIHPIIDRVFSLNEMSQAHEFVDKGHKVGDVVVVIP
ncbi:MAG: NAD(P)-dependent alcohol dehydrogenase [Salibacteraceae bacterium]